MEQQNQQIAVVGAGIIGLNCAIKLQQAGFNVTLLDKNAIGQGCSEQNAGHFATEQVFALADSTILWQLPKLLLDPLGPVALSPRYFFKAIPWFIKFFKQMGKNNQAHNHQALKALNSNAIEHYQILLKQANAEQFLTRRGSLLVFETSNRTEVEQVFNHYQQGGVSVKLLEQAEIKALEPEISEQVKFALFFPDVGHCQEPYQLSIALADYAKQLGVEFQPFNVKQIVHQPYQVQVKNSEQTLSFDRLVLATGAYSKPLCQQLGYQLPIEAERGYSLSLLDNPQTNIASCLSRPVASYERKFIITPMAQKLRLAGTVEYAGLNAKANYQRATLLLKHLPHLIKQNTDHNQLEQQTWMGARPTLPDSLPVIGQAPKHHNIYFALGHQHLGLTQGAVTGHLIAQVMTEQTPDIDLNPFCISRFN